MPIEKYSLPFSDSGHNCDTLRYLQKKKLVFEGTRNDPFVSALMNLKRIAYFIRRPTKRGLDDQLPWVGDRLRSWYGQSVIWRAIGVSLSSNDKRAIFPFLGQNVGVALAKLGHMTFSPSMYDDVPKFISHFISIIFWL